MAMRSMVTFSAPAALPNHVALCIGNSKYASSPLQNAAHDAEDVAALCRKLGISTEVVCWRQAWSRCWARLRSSSRVSRRAVSHSSSLPVRAGSRAPY